MCPIPLDRIVKSFGAGSLAVQDVSLDIHDGEFVILVGPSGCGKSTVLRMIAGLEDITSGELRIDDARFNEKAPRERNLAMVFQNYALYPHLTVCAARCSRSAEPLSNLDARLRGQMRTEIARIQRQLGVTTVYVTHDQTEAMTLGDRVAVLRKGALQQVDRPRQLYEHPANLFVAGFIG